MFLRDDCCGHQIHGVDDHRVGGGLEILQTSGINMEMVTLVRKRPHVGQPMLQKKMREVGRNIVTHGTNLEPIILSFNLIQHSIQTLELTVEPCRLSVQEFAQNGQINARECFIIIPVCN